MTWRCHSDDRRNLLCCAERFLVVRASLPSEWQGVYHSDGRSLPVGRQGIFCVDQRDPSSLRFPSWITFRTGRDDKSLSFWMELCGVKNLSRGEIPRRCASLGMTGGPYNKFNRRINSGRLERLTGTTSFLIRTLLSSMSMILLKLMIKERCTLRKTSSGNLSSIFFSVECTT